MLNDCNVALLSHYEVEIELRNQKCQFNEKFQAEVELHEQKDMPIERRQELEALVIQLRREFGIRPSASSTAPPRLPQFASF